VRGAGDGIQDAVLTETIDLADPIGETERMHTDLQSQNLTTLLNEAGAGDAAALERVWKSIHREVHGMAVRACSAERVGGQLQPTLLVNELFIKLYGPGVSRTVWDDRRHFWGAVGRAMAQQLIDLARNETRLRRGGGQVRIPLHIAAGELAELDRALSPEAVAAVEALDELERVSKECAEVARLRFLAGLSVEQTSVLLDIAPRTVSKRWKFAQAWLRRALAEQS
jgi:RNA polymerase sigma factor (TIGR02999 family)